MTMKTSAPRTGWWRLDYLDDPDFTTPPADMPGAAGLSDWTATETRPCPPITGSAPSSTAGTARETDASRPDGLAGPQNVFFNPGHSPSASCLCAHRLVLPSRSFCRLMYELSLKFAR